MSASPVSEVSHPNPLFVFSTLHTNNMATATTTLSTGADANLLIFSVATYYSEAEEKEGMAGYCVWTDDFVSMSVPQRRLIESLLWHLHDEGLSCAVFGLFPSSLAGRLKQALLAGIYISTYGTSDSEMTRTVLQYGTLLRYFTLREIEFTVLSTTEPRGYEVVTM